MALHDQITSFFPNVSGSLIVTVITWIIIVVLVLVATVVFTFLFIKRRHYNNKIMVFQKVGGGIQRVRIDKARVMKLGDAGDTVFYTLKTKKYLPTPQIQTGNREFWFYIREDGEWINFGLGDIDEIMRKAGAMFLDKEMRYARTSLQKGLRERYQKPNFFQQYGVLIMNLSYILVIAISLWLLFDKFIETANVLKQTMELTRDVLAETKAVVGGLDSLKASGSLQPAG